MPIGQEGVSGRAAVLGEGLQGKSELSQITFVTGAQVVWGAEMSMLSLAQELSRYADVRLICSNPKLAEAWKQVVGTHCLLTKTRVGRLLRILSFARPLATSPEGVTIILFDYYLLPLIPALRPMLRLKNVRVVLDLHDSAARSAPRRMLFQLMRFCDLVICVSDYIAQQVQGRVPRAVVDRPVTSERRTGEVGHAGKVHGDSIATIGVVGQVIASKKIIEAIDLVAELGGDFALVVRGSAPPGGSGYQARVEAYGRARLGKRFRFEGPVSSSHVMDGLTAIIHLNDDEPFGRVVAEAQLAGVVPIVSDSGGAAGLVTDGLTGIVLRGPLSPASIQHVRKVLTDPVQLARLRTLARDEASRRYDPASVGCAYFRVIRAQLPVDS